MYGQYSRAGYNGARTVFTFGNFWNLSKKAGEFEFGYVQQNTTQKSEHTLIHNVSTKGQLISKANFKVFI